MIKARTRRFVALGGVLALSVALLAGGPYESKPAGSEALAWCSMPNVICTIAYLPDLPPRPPSFRELVSVPLPTRLTTNGVSGCVRGAVRPVLDTDMPTVAATFATPVDATFEVVPLDGSEVSTEGGARAEAGKPVVWEAGGFGLKPGQTYRWRVRGTPWSASNGWSEWCEFTVAPGLLDQVIDDTTVEELRVDALRRYPVTLTVRQWRLVLDSFDPEDEDVTGADGQLVSDYDVHRHEQGLRLEAAIRAGITGRAAGRPADMVLTGNDWAYLASSLASWATASEDRYGEEPETGDDGPRYWKVLDRISAQLGGPKHQLREE